MKPVESVATSSGSIRPSDPTQLLVHRDIKEFWQARNIKANRFSVLNTEVVTGRLGLEHTTAKKYFDRAKISIEESKWKDDFGFEFGCSHTQIYPKNVSVSRQFGHAVTAIVALEFAAAELKPGYDVYTQLRIMPITYFVDLFDRAELEKARKAVNDFDKRCLAAIGQEFDGKLLDQHSWGLTITKPVAEKLLDFLKAEIPGEKYGPVRCAGDPDQRSKSLATKNRAPDLTIPVNLNPVSPL
jgi:hypothetical protein